MELLFVTIIGAGIAAIVRYLVPGREAHGALVLPALGAVVTAAVWVALVWLGWSFDGGWIWVVSLVAGGIAALVYALVTPRRREKADARLFAELSGGKA
jgi:hypothetical protein